MHDVIKETPIPVVDLDRLERNLDRMSAYSSRHGLALRPHTKTHKSPRIAAEQIRRGAVGLTCATILEAEVMLEASTDLLLAYPPVGQPKLDRLFSLPQEGEIAVALDSATVLENLAATARARDRQVGVLIELDLGMHRVGVSNIEEAIELAKLVKRRSPLAYRGIAFYPGHIRSLAPSDEEQFEALGVRLRETVAAFERAGVGPGIVSGGSTPTAWRSHELPEITEIRPGTYVYNDRITSLAGACEWSDCALTILATVVSTSVAGQAVVDAGSKALGREPAEGNARGYGALLEAPDVVITRMSEEHGILDLSATDWRPAVGDQVRIVPNHVCIAVHLHEVVHGVRGDRWETSWPVTARGRRPLGQPVEA